MSEVRAQEIAESVGIDWKEFRKLIAGEDLESLNDVQITSLLLQTQLLALVRREK